MAHDAGCDVTVIERTQDACERLHEITSATAIASDDPATTVSGLGTFDAIVGWHVIEHLPRPDVVIRASAASLNEGGILVLATPNPRSLSFKVMGARWPHVDAPRHLSILDPDAVAGCAGAQMTVVELTDLDPGSRHWDNFAWHYLMRRPGSPPLIDAGFQTIGTCLGRALSPLTTRGLRGAAYTIVLRKQAV